MSADCPLNLGYRQMLDVFNIENVLNQVKRDDPYLKNKIIAYYNKLKKGE